MEGHPGSDPPLSTSQALLSSLLNGSDSTLASSLAHLPEAKTLLSQLLGGTQSSQANLQQILSAATVSMVAQQQQRLPTLKPTNLSSAAGHLQIVTTPTQPIPTAGRKRGRPPAVDQDDGVKKRRGGYTTGRGTGEKQSKGLRHFSQLVCEKVREKGITSYNEVADELVKELDEQEQKSGSEMQIDQKNIRRRVYDALNVLMAMNIISKEKKEIRWIGLPTNSVQECEHIQTELSQCEERITKKRSELHELVLQILTLKNLMKRNRDRAETGDPPTQNSAIGLPFILVNTNKQTVIDCSISSDKSEYVFNFDNTFELHQDVDILKKMGLECGLHTGTSTPESLCQAKVLLPRMFEPVLEEMAQMSALSSTVAPQSPLHHAASFPAPTTPLIPPSTASNILTPLLSDTSNGPTYSSPPLAATPTPTLANSQNALAAALSTLQQLQQIGSQPSSSSSSSSTSSTINSIPVSFTIPTTSPVTLLSGTVTARPIPNFTSSPKAQTVPISPLLRAQLSSVGATNTASVSAGSILTQGKPPGAKVVTVHPLPGNASVADIIASLQQNVSTLLKQQQQGSIAQSNLSSLLNGLQQQTASDSAVNGVSAGTGKILTQNPTT